MRRRDFITLVSAVAAGWPFVARAQQPAVPVIGFLSPASPEAYIARLDASLARPGGNVTGLSQVYFTLTAKRLEMLHELIGRPLPIAMLVNPSNPYTEQEINAVQATAKALGLELHVLNARGERDLTAAFRSMVEIRAGALLVGADPVFTNLRDRVIALAASHRIAAIYGYREFTADGGLMSYGINVAAAYRQVGLYAGRILRGEKPADLPVMQPTKFALVINLKTAKALGLTVPSSLLARANEVIE
jgi:ABC-type uncharacterized transport system substrate-binding protein